MINRRTREYFVTVGGISTGVGICVDKLELDKENHNYLYAWSGDKVIFYVNLRRQRLVKTFFSGICQYYDLLPREDKGKHE